jgi:CBS domain-containing protein/mannitol/fructose-specific phosphotransferase system IIA component (Ntr-type)
MNLLDLLPHDHLVVPLRADSLHDAVLVLARRLHEAGAVRDLDAVEARLTDEALRDGLATRDAVVAHLRTPGVDTLALALGVAPEPIPGDDDAPDTRARVVALVLGPPDGASLYLQATSTLGRLVQEEGVVDDLARQGDPDAVRALPALQDLRIQHSLVVRDVMTHRIHSVPPEWTVRRTLDLMLRRKLGAVPVVGEAGEVLGMVTDADIMRALLPKIPRARANGDEGSEPSDRSVRDIMTRSVLCVSEDLGVSEVASMMINKDVEQVPVVNAGSIAGMVYRRDIIRKLFGRS